MTQDESERLSRAATTNLTIAMELRATAWALTEAGLRAFRPELDEAAIQSQVRAQFRRSGG